MKRIIIFRHGKSDWNADFDRDHERPLAPRGIKASKLMGIWLKNTEQLPDYCMVSSAVRTRQTYELAATAGGWTSRHEIKETLYASSINEYIGAIKQAPEDVDTLVIVGHEPTCSMTTAWLAGGDSDIRFPTATMARIDVEIDDWQSLDADSGQLVWLQPPRLLPKKILKAL